MAISLILGFGIRSVSLAISFIPLILSLIHISPLSEYARMALNRPEPSKENIMCVIDEACSSCVQINYEITNLCRGCVARSCYMNCPKDAIRFKKNGQAMIDHDTCVSCGICHKSCPCLLYTSWHNQI